MVVENTGEQNVSAAGSEQTGESGKITAEGQQATKTPAAEGSADLQTQIEAFKAKALDETQKRQTAEDTARIAQDQLALTRANQQPPQQPKGLFGQVVEKLGYGDEEFLDKEQTGNVLNAMLGIVSTSNAQRSFVNQHSDYAEVVGAIDPRTGEFRVAAPLQRVLDKDPQLALELQENPRPATAYHLAVTDPEYQASKAKEVLTPEQLAAQQAAEAVNAANQQASISSVAGGGNLDKAAVIQNMTPEQFQVYKDKILAKGGVT